jgi:lysophospholipase L1-like esterase
MGEAAALQDLEGTPYFSHQGGLKHLKTTQGMKILQIKSDLQNRPWILYERTADAHNELYLGRLVANEITQRTKLTRGQEGLCHSPDMDFSPSQEPWTVFVNIAARKQRLIVQDLANDRHWVLQAPRATAVFSPRLLLDMTGQAWLFWVGQDGGLDEIFYTRLDPAAAAWIKPASLTGDPTVPHFHPDAALNAKGEPMVVWSGFDGEDYEVYFTAWDSGRWTPPFALTNNRFCGDGQPSLSSYMGIPIVAWTHTHSDGTAVLFSYREQNAWIKPVRLSPDSRNIRSPRLLSQGLNLAITWEEKRSRTQILTFPPAAERAPRAQAPRLRIQSPLLESNKFIGFGDSITFGSMNGPRMGLGYTPRLQALLRDLFTDPLVTNRGVPGEPTWEAVSRIHSVLDNDMALYLLLMEGTNDVSTLEYSIDSIIFNLQQILNACLSRGGIPLISTIIPRARDRWTASAKARTTELNRKIGILASDLKVIIVHNYGAFIDFPDEAGGHEALISSDNLHPNDTGYQVMAEAWFQKIKIVPFPPIGIEAKKSQSQQRITLTWEDDPRIIPSTQLSRYLIYRTSKTANDPQLIASVPATVHTFRDTQVSSEEEYRYFLRAKTELEREGPLSEGVIPERSDPFPPLNITSETLINKAYLFWEYVNRINWEDNPQNQGEYEIVSHRIYRKLKGQINTSYQLIAEVSASDFTYLDRGISGKEAAESYQYTVTAVDSDGQESPLGES